MRNSKSIRSNITMLLLCFSCAMFMALSVFALNNTFNFNMSINSSPHMLYKLDFSQDSGDNKVWTTIFDNYNSTSFVNSSVIKTSDKNSYVISPEITEDTFFLKVTNYTANERLKLVVESYTINGLTKTDVNISSQECDAYVEDLSPSYDYVAIPTAEVLFDNTKVAYQIKVQNALNININDLNAFVSNIEQAGNGDAIISLDVIHGSELPETVSLTRNGETLSSCVDYTYSKADQTLTVYNYSNLLGRIDVDCQSIQSFKIMEYPATATKPTNGLTGDDLVRYQYYTELGEYPQQYVGDTLNDSLTQKKNNNELTLLRTYNQKINGISYPISWYSYEGEKYVFSKAVADNDTLKYSNGTFVGTTITDKWFKVKPINWVIIGTDSDTTTLNDLYYYNYNFYTDSEHTDEYTDGLLVLSELSLDTYAYSSEACSYSTSELSSFLNSSGNIFAEVSGIASLFKDNNATSSIYSEIVKNNTLTTTEYDVSLNTSTTINSSNFIFPLADFTGNTYPYGDYFSNGENSLISCCASDYSLAHNIFATTDTPSEYKICYSTVQSANNLSVSYWLRGYNLNNVYTKAVNMIGNSIVRSVSLDNVGVRPALVFTPNP